MEFPRLPSVPGFEPHPGFTSGCFVLTSATPAEEIPAVYKGFGSTLSALNPKLSQSFPDSAAFPKKSKLVLGCLSTTQRGFSAQSPPPKLPCPCLTSLPGLQNSFPLEIYVFLGILVRKRGWITDRPHRVEKCLAESREPREQHPRRKLPHSLLLLFIYFVHLLFLLIPWLQFFLIRAEFSWRSLPGSGSQISAQPKSADPGLLKQPLEVEMPGFSWFNFPINRKFKTIF